MTTRGDVGLLLGLEGAAVVVREDGHVRLRVPGAADPARLLRAVDRDAVRVTYEPPSLSELFRTAVTRSRESEDQNQDQDLNHDRDPEASHVGA